MSDQPFDSVLPASPAPPPKTAPEITPAEELERREHHWAGFPGEGEAQSYHVADRGRYGLLTSLLLVALILTALAVMIHGYKHAPGPHGTGPATTISQG
jgi:hypothetical protein